MMEPQKHDTSVGVMNSEKGHETIYRRPLGLTITVEMIDRVLADVEAQIENLQQDRINLGRVRVQLADMEVQWRGE